MNDVMTFFTHRHTKEIAAQLSGFKVNERALDLATGTGDLALLLRKKSQGTVIGTDLSEKMLSIAIKKSQTIEKEISFALADINNLPFSDETFDVCMIGFGIRNVHNPLNTMKEVARITKNRGRFVILEATPPTNCYVRFLGLFYFRKLAPLLAKAFLLNSKAYNYLAESISQFPKASDFSKIIKQAGWKRVYYYPLYLGLVTIFLAIK